MWESATGRSAVEPWTSGRDDGPARRPDGSRTLAPVSACQKSATGFNGLLVSPAKGNGQIES
jgi:hypothetical protein